MRDVATRQGFARPDPVDQGRQTFPGRRTIAGFTIRAFPEPPPEKLLTVAALNQKVYFHKLGDPQSADKLIYERPDHPNWGIDPLVMEGSRYLLLYMYTGVPGKNLLAYQDLRAANPENGDADSVRRFWV